VPIYSLSGSKMIIIKQVVNSTALLGFKQILGQKIKNILTDKVSTYSRNCGPHSTILRDLKD